MEEGQSKSQSTSEFGIFEQIVREKINQYKQEQNLALGIIGGGIGGLIGAIFWAAITYSTEHQVGIVALGVGILVGLGVRIFGKGLEPIFGVTGAGIALVSVLIGNFLALIGFLARAVDISYIDALLGFNYSMTIEFMIETYSVMDLLFCAIATYEGYRFSLRRIAKSDLLDGVITRNGSIIGEDATLSGGSGTSIDDAIVITAPSSIQGIPAEYAYVQHQCGRRDKDWILVNQELIEPEGPEGKMYDMLKIKMNDGTIREFYFDISSFFGKY